MGNLTSLKTSFELKADVLHLPPPLMVLVLGYALAILMNPEKAVQGDSKSNRHISSIFLTIYQKF